MDEKFEKAIELARKHFAFPINQKAELNAEALSDDPFPLFGYFRWSPSDRCEKVIDLIDAIIVEEWELAEKRYHLAIAETIVDCENYWSDEDHTLESIAENLSKTANVFGHNKIEM